MGKVSIAGSRPVHFFPIHMELAIKKKKKKPKHPQETGVLRDWTPGLTHTSLAFHHCVIISAAERLLKVTERKRDIIIRNN